jgi:pyridoxamine 5'-phosphate oxidase
MDSQFSDIRKEYKKGKLTRNTISENPFEQFARWLNDALHCGENEPTAMIVATVSPDGRPSTRTVLLKGVENGKLIFFTNYESRKGRQLTANPYISLSFVSRIGARISPQSHVISSRMEIIRAFVKEAARLTGQTVPRPDNWGGFAVTPTRFEFWQGRESRLHDRFEYTLHEEKSVSGLSYPNSEKWEINRLAP